MHRQFRKLLDSATGASEYIIALNLDIRGFSAFSKRVDSLDVAVFIRKAYIRIIDLYFTGASFYKSTGDGLFVIIPFEEKTLQPTLRKTVDLCFKLINEFEGFFVKDPMVTFDVPGKIGIGITRGSACCIYSGTKKIDYSGRILNQASRLMDLARPSGVVFDSSFGFELLTEEQKALFSKEGVYLRGIAEREPIEVYYSHSYTKISELSKQPIEHVKWEKIVDRRKLKEIQAIGSNFIFSLPKKPVNNKDIKIKISHNSIVKGKASKILETLFDFSDYAYYVEAGEPKISVNYVVLASKLKAAGVTPRTPVTITIYYPVR